MDYDLIVIGADHFGLEGALVGAQLNKRVALIPCHSTTTHPNGWFRDGVATTRTLHKTIRKLVGRQAVCADHVPHPESHQNTIDAVLYGTCSTRQERAEVLEELARTGISIRNGAARFLGPNEIEVTHEETRTVLTGDRFLIAVGTRPERPRYIPFDGQSVVDSEELLMRDDLPRSMIVVGGETLGLEYASLLAALGVQTTLINETERVLDSWDDDVVDRLMEDLRLLGVQFCLGDEVTQIERTSDNSVLVHRQNGKRLKAEMVLAGLDHVGRTDRLNLPIAGIEPDEKGRLWCNANYQTWVPHIYAVGDVVGFPTMANIGVEQGSHAVCHAFEDLRSQAHFSATTSSTKDANARRKMSQTPAREQLPFEQHQEDGDAVYALSTVPELAMVGKTEQQLDTEGVPYVADYVTRNEMSSGGQPYEQEVLLKLLSHRVTHRLLGAHALGEESVKLMKIAQTIMAVGGTVHDFCDVAQFARITSECSQVPVCSSSQTLESEQFPAARDCQDASTSAYDRVTAASA